MPNYFFYLLVFLTFTNCGAPKEGGSIKLDAEAFKSAISKNDIQLIDVRKPEEFKEGHIENAKNFDFTSKVFLDSIKLLDNSKPVYIYCRSGKRSSRSVKYFKAASFDSIFELKDGILSLE